MPPLRFRPLLRRTLWGGRRLGALLGKPLEKGEDFGESWEVADLPGWESEVASGPLSGHSIRELMQRQRVPLLGKHQPFERFPLLLKYIDARCDLSVQVHPRPRRTASGRVVGKTELWIVLDALPGSRMFAGLKPGVDETALRRAIADQDVEACLETCAPQTGDCLLIRPGTVHALGAGTLIAEVQQPCDVTYRLHDWDRVDAEGLRRELHVEQALAAIDFSAGPVRPIAPTPLPQPGKGEELVRSDNFIVHRYRGPERFGFPQDGRAHVLTVLEGELEGEGSDAWRLKLGETLVLPAEREPITLRLHPEAVLLDAFLP